MKAPFTLERTVKISDLLTTFTVIISLFALLSTINKDRESREHEAANKVRTAVAHAITKLDRWQALQLNLYQELQPTFVELSEILKKKHDTTYVRDQLWKKANLERTKIAKIILDEQLGTAYADLIAHFPAARAKFAYISAELTSIEAEITQKFLSDSEQQIFKLNDKNKHKATAILGNKLRNIADYHKQELKNRSDVHITPFRDYLLSAINKPDTEIIRASQKN